MLQWSGRGQAAIPAIGGLGSGRTLAPRLRDYAHRSRSGVAVGPMKVHTVQGGGGCDCTCARGHGGRSGDPVHPRLVAEPSPAGQQYDSTLADEFALSPTTCVVTACPRRPRARALHRRQAVGRRRRGDHRRARSRPSWCSTSAGPTGLSSSATTCAPRPGPDRGDQLRRGCGQRQRGGLRHADRPGTSTTSPTPRPTICRPTPALRAFVRDCVVKPVSDDDLETAMCWNVVVPAAIRFHLFTRETRLRRRAGHAQRAVARNPGPGGLGRATSDGRARPHRLPHLRGVVVRRCRSRAIPGGSRAVQPRAGRFRPGVHTS